MDKFSKRLVSNIRVTKESALKMTIQSKKRKRKIAASVRILNNKCGKSIAIRRSSISKTSQDEVQRHKSYEKGEEQVDVLPDINLPRTFLSSKRQSSTTPKDLSKRLSLSISQVALTFKATSQKLTRSSVIPLARRYRLN